MDVTTKLKKLIQLVDIAELAAEAVDEIEEYEELGKHEPLFHELRDAVKEWRKNND
jgi:hypothetical protein